MAKRRIIAFGVALILILTVIPLSPNLATVSAGDEPASEESHFQAIIPGTTDPTVNLPSVADACVSSKNPNQNFGDSTINVCGF